MWSCCSQVSETAYVVFHQRGACLSTLASSAALPCIAGLVVEITIRHTMAVTLTALPQSMEQSEYKMALLTMLWRQVLHAADGAKLRDVRVARLLRRHGRGVVSRQHRHQHYSGLHTQLDTHMLCYDESRLQAQGHPAPFPEHAAAALIRACPHSSPV